MSVFVQNLEGFGVTEWEIPYLLIVVTKKSISLRDSGFGYISLVSPEVLTEPIFTKSDLRA